MCLGSQSVELITQDQSEFSSQNHYENDGSEHRHEEDLQVQLHQPDPCRPIERLPCIEHGHRTAATQNFWLDFTSEGAVERNNGLILLW